MTVHFEALVCKAVPLVCVRRRRSHDAACRHCTDRCTELHYTALAFPPIHHWSIDRQISSTLATRDFETHVLTTVDGLMPAFIGVYSYLFVGFLMLRDMGVLYVLYTCFILKFILITFNNIFLNSKLCRQVYPIIFFYSKLCSNLINL